jgi:hypothetical protein
MSETNRSFEEIQALAAEKAGEQKLAEKARDSAHARKHGQIEEDGTLYIDEGNGKFPIYRDSEEEDAMEDFEKNGYQEDVATVRNRQDKAQALKEKYGDE